jgi:hypothetical protein
MALAISTGKVDITPPVGSIMAGYGVDTPRVATGVNRPLRARCTIFWDDGWPNAIVTVDTLAFGRSLHINIRDRVAAIGIPQGDFVLSTSHTHSGPATTEKLDPFIAYNANATHRTQISNLSTALADKIVQLVQDTYNATRVPCTLDYKVTTQNWSYNREGMSYRETDVPVLVARNSSGAPLAVLFSYGCHPVAGGSQTLLDPDYPGAAADRIESSTGALAQFILGPCGDQNPDGVFSLSYVDQLGQNLATAVTTAMATPGRALAGPILTGYSTVSLPLDITPTPGNMQVVKNIYQQRQQNYPSGYHRRHAQTMIQQIDSNTFATSVPLPIQVWKLSGAPGLRMVFSGGEVVSGFAVYMRSLYGGSSRLLYSTCCHETLCYIPSDELLRRGESYAGGFDADHPGIAGGSMTVYGYLGHFRGKPTASSPNGVEQIYINAVRSLLGTP